MQYTDVKTKPQKAKQVSNSISKLDGILYVGKSIDDENLLVIHFDPLLDDKEVKKLKTKISKIAGIHKVNDISQGDTSGAIHCFFDIDGTLTQPQMSHVGIQVREIFEMLRKANVYIYFATGRSVADVRALMSYFSATVEKWAIAENGGILINPTHPDGFDKFGTRDEPLRFFRFLKKNRRVQEDTNQRNRETEMIILRGNLTPPQMKRLKIASNKTEKIRVEVLEGGSTYHITPKGVNKGSALAKFVHKRELSSEFNTVVSAGDTELDISMFQESKRSYLIGTATPEIRKEVTRLVGSGNLNTTILTGDYIRSLKTIYEDIAKIS